MKLLGRFLTRKIEISFLLNFFTIFQLLATWSQQLVPKQNSVKLPDNNNACFILIINSQLTYNLEMIVILSASEQSIRLQIF